MLFNDIIICALFLTVLHSDVNVWYFCCHEQKLSPYRFTVRWVAIKWWILHHIYIQYMHVYEFFFFHCRSKYKRPGMKNRRSQTEQRYVMCRKFCTICCRNCTLTHRFPSKKITLCWKQQKHSPANTIEQTNCARYKRDKIQRAIW